MLAGIDAPLSDFFNSHGIYRQLTCPEGAPRIHLFEAISVHIDSPGTRAYDLSQWDVEKERLLLWRTRSATTRLLA